jgi:guanine deaminase
MFNEMKEAVENSKYADLYCDVAPPMTLPEAFYAATLGGAKVLSMDKEIGSLEKGKKADFLIIDYLKYKKSNFLKPRQILSKLIYRGDASVVQKVFVQGKQVRPVL